VRDQKTDEENYLLYLKKREEARMSDALDQRGILNVIVAEQPLVPVLPVGSPGMTIVLGFVLGAILSIGMALAADYLDPSFRTPSEVLDELNIPVLAAVPYHGGANGMNGDSSGRHHGNGNHSPAAAEGLHVAEVGIRAGRPQGRMRVGE
jgi:hypothetical protein